ncbi:MAG: hypothetical protein R3D29_04320 [Nitratireductor sp.]
MPQTLPPRLPSRDPDPVPAQHREPGIRVPPVGDPAGRAEPVLVDDPYAGYPDENGYDDRIDYGADDDDRDNVSRAMLAGAARQRGAISALRSHCLRSWASDGLATRFTTIFDKTDATTQAQNGNAQQSDPAGGDEPTDGTYLVLLSASDTAALDTQGRGTAEIVTQSNTEMLRLTSLRASDNKEETAKPILLAVQPGVLSRIAGKNVTVEIRAKSGGTGPATFSVSCDFDGQELCGRKRFRVGLQPEVMIFKLAIPASASSTNDAHFSLSTDITGSAALTGQGDVIDIQYARLRLDNE